MGSSAKDSNSKLKQSNISYGPNIRYNSTKVTWIHDLTSLVIGVTSGILKLESLLGFLFFCLFYSLINLFIYLSVKTWIVKNHQNSNLFTDYFTSFFNDLFVVDFSKSITSFIMMWTLTYTLIET
ncbi:Emc6p ASCRUDRAFT_40101 [Ascoidea rubescens DSM 1968]|uniref:ER membrane protein complex subunit 6 n=1 Tax=Ascoidea rubescens DSM 1968 TaxID=1344418 RepID=A0A1D2V914_9ASCO|nr:hypothetical protein ASCRUDRAFT_40101 [Ascoidea rubescens DSM 1968]ODV57943.1 hypothetical protein ASCRUDRAFT_40101 [Ascoidea rubescens DSM 1968]